MEPATHLEQAVAAREKLLMQLYKQAFPAVAAYVAKMDGSFDEAKDIFQDALVSYYEKVITGNVEIKTTPKAYLLGTARHLWLRKYAADSLQVPIDDNHTDEIADETPLQPHQHKLMQLLETAGQRCMILLRSFYYDKLSLDEIAPMFGFSGTRSATVQKYKCLEKVRETVKQKALQYEDFID